jgi:hypothetical protein
MVSSKTNNDIRNIIMKTLRETTYLRFIDKEAKQITKIIGVVNIHHDEEIGEIKWFGKWRQYCFYPSPDTIWNTGCMKDICEVINDLMNKRKVK